MRLSWARVVVALSALVLVGCSVLSGVAGGAGQRLATVVIKSVTVSGTPARPIFTITGSGLSVPAPSPSVSPSGQPLCPVKIAGSAGLDYGTHLYLIGWDGQPNGSNKQLYSAGRYRPKLNELDCIGLIVLSHSPSKLVFTFGHAYTQFRSQYRQLQTGDVIELVVNAASFATVVRYHH
jgi:hypothetical protein